FSASAEAGALVGGGDDAQVNALKQYGRSLGAAFQIRDDVLDFTASKDMLGKPTFIDLKMGRPTLVMLLAKNNGLKRDDMLSMTPEELHDALEPCIEKAGRIAEQKSSEAKHSLRNIVDGRAKDLLLKLSDYAVVRAK
ncbi:MAG TPA: polyprenyl synthetase family protein, partial [Methanocellaceae archaeon]